MGSKLRGILFACLSVICACSLFAAVGCKKDDGKTEDKTYTVTFDLCTDLQTTTALPRKVKAGTRIDEPKIYVTGDNPDNYEIEGWYSEKNYSEDSKWDFSFDSVESDVTLYAKWGSHKQYKVRFYKAGDGEATYIATIEQGLTASECDDRFGGYKVLGYYTSPEFDKEFDFEAAINADTDVFVKLSDYIYLSPKYLAGFEAKNNASCKLATDGSTVEITYETKDSFIYQKGLNLALNGRELLEIIYKLEGGDRADIYWYASDGEGKPVAGFSDFNEVTKSIGAKSFFTEITTDEDGWTHAVYDLTKPRGYADGKIGQLTDVAVLNGIRLDISGGSFPAKFIVKSVQGQKKPELLGNPVEFYVDGELKSTIGVANGEKAQKPADEELVLGRQIVGYYTDEAFTSEFDFNTPITEATVLYAKTSDYMYFNGAMLDGFTPMSGATKTLNDDGTLSLKGNNGSFIHRKGLAIDINDGNCIEMKVKAVDFKVYLYLFGTYTLDGAGRESTDYGQENTLYRGLATQGWTVSEPDAEGYVIMKFDLAYTKNGESAQGVKYNVIKGFRIDIAEGADKELVIEYVKSTVGSEVSEPKKYAVNYYVGAELKHTESVAEGSKPSRVSDDTFVIDGRTVIGYYKDSAFTEAFDFNAAITADTNVYVKLLNVYSVDYYVGTELKYSEKVTEGASTPRVSDKLFAEEGRTVLGYYKDSAFTEVFDFNAAVSGDVKVYVKLSDKVYPVYTVNFYVGTEIKYTEKVTEGGKITEVTDDKFEEGGRKVLGYYKDAAFSERFDLNSAITTDTKVYVRLSEAFTVNYYAGETLIYGETVSDGDLPNGVPEEKLSFYGRELLGFFADEALTEEFDFNASVTANTSVYVKISDYMYFNGAMLDGFTPAAGATKTLNEDGTLTFKGNNGAFIYKKEFNLDLNGGNYITIKAKSDIKLGGFFDFYIFGEYTSDGVAAESTDFGQANTRYRARTEDGCVIGEADANGYRTYTFRLSDPIGATGKIEYKTIKGFRIGINGGNEENNLVIEYVKSLKLVSLEYYYGTELIKAEGLAAGEYAKALADGNVMFGRQIVGYYTDAALTNAFDIAKTAITEDTKLYIKTSDYLYFNGAMLDGFNAAAGATKTLNEDGTLTLKGNNGAFIYKKGLNLDLNGGNYITIKAKSDIKLGGFFDFYIFGEYTSDGVAAESTDFGQANTRYRARTEDGCVIGEADANGYRTYTFRLSDPIGATGKIEYKTIKGFRIGINGGNEENNLVIEYVKSVKV